MPKADSIAPESVEQETASLAPKPAPGIPASLEDRVIQLRELYDAHGHLLVPRTYTSDRCVDWGQWVKAIRQFHKRIGKSSYLSEESPGIVFGPNKLSKLRIDRLEALGFQMVKPANGSLEYYIIYQLPLSHPVLRLKLKTLQICPPQLE
jgi:hypothetical protein